MAKGPRQGKGPQRRPRKPVRRAGSSSTGRRTQTASSATGQGRGRTFSINTAKNATALVSKEGSQGERCDFQGRYDIGKLLRERSRR